VEERVAVRFWGKNFQIFSLPNRFNILRNAGENNTHKKRNFIAVFVLKKEPKEGKKRRNFAVCSVWWWLAWLVGDPSWRWRPMIANGHPISSWPRNKYSWSLFLSFSLCILYIDIYIYIHTCSKLAPYVKKEKMKKSARSLLVFLSLSSFCRIWRRGGKRKFFNTCFFTSASSLDNYNARLF
jgi:hypothetical protein